MEINDIGFVIMSDRAQSLDEKGYEDDLDKDMEEVFGTDTDETE